MKRVGIDKEIVREINEKCEGAHLYDFAEFLNLKRDEDKSLFELLEQVKQKSSFAPCKKDKKIKFNEYLIADYMNEFFTKYMPEKASEVRQILDRTHPYFIDSDGNPHVTFTRARYGDNRTSHVGHFGKRSFLEFDVYYHDSVDDLRTTAHELSHALSSRNQRFIENIRAGVENIDNFEKDSIFEIESLITEKLFNRFLVGAGIYSSVDMENYDRAQQNSLLNEINLIKEEQVILSALPRPVTSESLNDLVQKLQKNKQGELLERLKTMPTDKKDGPYMFRYVVGRIVSDQWIKQFENALDKQAREEMLANFQNYLDKTHEIGLDEACGFLLGQNFSQLVENYAKNQTNEQKTIKTRFF